MNKKLDSLIGQRAVEKLGKGGALTTFLREAWVQQKKKSNRRDRSNTRRD